LKNVVIVGATSAMAEAVAKRYAMEGANLYLLARNMVKLEAIKEDLMVRGAAEIHTSSFDAADCEFHEASIEVIFSTFTKVDVFLIAHGSLPNQEKCQGDVNLTIQEINTNGISAISLLTHVANKMESQKSGNITVITSVAGDRGRQSNYVYGAAKGMVSIFLQGLAQRLYKSGVHVLDIKPGFVDTPMTAEFDKGPLWEKPEKVADIIFNRINKKSTFSYTPGFWLIIMSIIKSVPKFVFNKVSL
jgi:decaprenylphospho-beta-D-erythro-pentofuranosid-2-ulose 2-reductase